MKKSSIKKLLVSIALATPIMTMAKPNYTESNFHSWTPKTIINQLETGKYGTTNCVPSAVYNTLDMLGYKNLPSVEEIKSDMKDGRNLSEGTTIYEMTRYLTKEKISYHTIKDLSKENILKELDKAPIISCIDLDKNRYYDIDSAKYHAFVLIGYLENENGTYLLIEDSNNGGIVDMWKYEDWYACASQFYNDTKEDCLYVIDDILQDLQCTDNNNVNDEFLQSIYTIQYDFRDCNAIFYTIVTR